jgi:hypothetical protein
MVWHVRQKSDERDRLLIEYSYGDSKACDGVLLYDKNTEEITIVKMSNGADEFYTKWLFPHIYRLLRENDLTIEKRRICIG